MPAASKRYCRRCCDLRMTIAWTFRRVPDFSSPAIFLSKRFPLPTARSGDAASLPPKAASACPNPWACPSASVLVPHRHLYAISSTIRRPSALMTGGPGPRKVDTSGVSYAAWVSVADVSASKSSGARRLHQECRLRVL